MMYRRLSILEYGSVGCFLVGLGLGVAYLEMSGNVERPPDKPCRAARAALGLRR